MQPIIVAIALICGAEECGNKVQEPRFETISSCEKFLSEERLRESRQGRMVVLDDCIITTEQRIGEFK